MIHGFDDARAEREYREAASEAVILAAGAFIVLLVLVLAIGFGAWLVIS